MFFEYSPPEHTVFYLIQSVLGFVWFCSALVCWSTFCRERNSLPCCRSFLRAVITNRRKPGGLNNKYLFSRSSGSQKSETNTLAGLCSLWEISGRLLLPVPLLGTSGGVCLEGQGLRAACVFREHLQRALGHKALGNFILFLLGHYWYS